MEQPEYLKLIVIFPEPTCTHCNQIIKQGEEAWLQLSSIVEAKTHEDLHFICSLCTHIKTT